jgi:hypothetical protein
LQVRGISTGEKPVLSDGRKFGEEEKLIYFQNWFPVTFRIGCVVCAEMARKAMKSRI